MQAFLSRYFGSPSHVETSVSLCPTCSTLDFMAMLRDGVSDRWEAMIQLGPLVDIMHKANHCRFCHLITLLFRRCWCLDTLPHVDLSGVACFLYAAAAGALADPDTKERERCHRLHIRVSNRPREITDVITQKNMHLTLDIQLLEEDAHKFRRAREVHGRRMTATADMALMRRWLALCEREHGRACESAWWRGSDVLPPFVRVVDVTLMSLVQAPSDCRYVALSYVWGIAGDGYWTTKTNVDSRGLPAGLDSSILPATIMDSICVTRALGERYLWVDALCIVQDSSDDKDEQIRAMELIYNRAVLTIFAAGGENVHARLPGVSAGSRSLHQHIEDIQGLHLTLPLPSLREAMAQSVWNTRGWTYQELVISRRRLFFTNHQVYFECTKDVWCEDLVAESKTVQFSDHPMRHCGSGASSGLRNPPARQAPDYMSSYIAVVDQYTRRHLSYPSDIIPAVTAVTNAMTRGYQLADGNPDKAFRYGMQIRDLELSLLWQPRPDSAHTRRVSPDTGLPTWPSWAWAGWIGAAFYVSLDLLIHPTTAGGHTTEPAESLVENWYLVDRDQQLIRLEVVPIWFSRIGDSKIPMYIPPIGDIDPPHPLPPAGTLVFRTQRALLSVFKVETTSNYAASLPHAIFQISSDVRRPSSNAGRMMLPSMTPSPSSVECIVLSRCGGMMGLYDEDVYGRFYGGCLLNVMAVKRVGEHTEVRERVGLGVVVEQAWLDCGAQVETVFLG